ALQRLLVEALHVAAGELRDRALHVHLDEVADVTPVLVADLAVRRDRRRAAPSNTPPIRLVRAKFCRAHVANRLLFRGSGPRSTGIRVPARCGARPAVRPRTVSVIGSGLSSRSSRGRRDRGTPWFAGTGPPARSC